jgi:hypothetical protein
MRSPTITPTYLTTVSRIGRQLDRTLANPRPGNGVKDLLAACVSEPHAEYTIRQVCKLPGWSLDAIIRTCAKRKDKLSISPEKRKAYALVWRVARGMKA